jgi:VanZ family protein
MNYKKIGLVLVILIAIEIFYISSIVPPELSPEGNRLIPIAYHFIIFTLFSFFLYLSIYKNEPEDNYFFVLIFSILYAISDELHQLFIPNRVCSYGDFLIDFGGICLGIILFAIINEGMLKYERN